MLYITSTRKELFQLISKPQRPSDILFAKYDNPNISPEPSTMWVCWNDSDMHNDGWPTLIIIPDNEVNDFFAWAVTFLQHLRPLSSFIRIISWSQYQRSETLANIIPQKYGELFMGALLGEVLIDANLNESIETIPLPVFESTYSAAIGRGILSGYNSDTVALIKDGWRFAHQFANQGLQNRYVDSLDSVWNILSLFVDGSNNSTISPIDMMLCEACWEIFTRGEVAPSILHNFSSFESSNMEIIKSLNYSKERRVEVFENAVRQIPVTDANNATSSFLFGYLASIVSGGSLDHCHLIKPLRIKFPTVSMWYGICTALRKGNSILGDNHSLGWKLLRSMNSIESISSIPNYDISIDELKIILRGQSRVPIFWQRDPMWLRIEVTPLISTTIKWPPRTTDDNSNSTLQTGNVTDHSRHDQLYKLAASLRDSLKLAESLLNISSNTTSRKKIKKR